MNETDLNNLIAQAAAEGWTELDLRGQYLEALPEALGQLHQLEILRLGYLPNPYRRNYLTQLPSWFSQLANLHTLDLYDNDLTQLPDWFSIQNKFTTVKIASY